MTPLRVRAIRDGLFVAGLAVLALLLVEAWRTASDTTPGEAFDAWIYWSAARGEAASNPVLGGHMAYLYSPAFVQVFGPLLALPFTAFLAAWYALGATALIAVVRWWLPAVVLSGVIVLDVIRGNIETLMAVAIVAGFRWPAAWAFILLTKVTPGVGLMWFVGRREWRSLGIAVGATAAVVLVSFVLAPNLWQQWLGVLASNAGVGSEWEWVVLPLSIRVPIGAALAFLAGRRGWPWLVPVASTIALPALWPVNLTLLVAAIPLLRAAPDGVIGRGALPSDPLRLGMNNRRSNSRLLGPQAPNGPLPGLPSPPS